MKKYAYATVATSLTYIIGAARLYQRLEYLGSKYPLLIIITDNVSEEELEILHRFNIPYYIKPYNHFYNRDMGGYINTLNKFLILEFTEYEKIIFMDADSFPVYNIDYLFLAKFLEGQYFITFSEARDEKFGWVKGGLFICKPNKEIFDFIFSNNIIYYYYMNDESILSRIFYGSFTNIPLQSICFIPHFAGTPLKIWDVPDKTSLIYNLFHNASALDFNLFFDKYYDDIIVASDYFEQFQRMNEQLQNKVSAIKHER